MKDLTWFSIYTLSLDVTDENAIREVRDKVVEITGGKLDVLVITRMSVSSLHRLKEN